jgi:hypothetical protein
MIEREERLRVRVVRDTILYCRNIYIFGDEGSQAVAAGLSGKGRLKKGKAFRSGEGRDVKGGAGREVKQF